MAAYDDLNGKRITAISVISILVTAVTVLAVQVLYYAMAGFVDEQKVRSASYARQNRILEDQAKEVSSYGIDKETGNVTVPVSEIMKKMVEQGPANKANDEA